MSDPVLSNSFLIDPEPTTPIETDYRRIQTALPVPESVPTLNRANSVFPLVNCYQPPVVWDRAEGAAVFDPYGNRWIDFTSTAVMTNSGHGHPRIRKAVQQHLQNEGLMAQFSFLSEIRIQLAERLVELAPDHCDKVHFWTVGSEAIECALRLAREHGRQFNERKIHILTHEADYHGWTLGAHQMSGVSARKEWLATPDAAIHHLPFPRVRETAGSEIDWMSFLNQNLDRLAGAGIEADQICAVFVETLQGWGAVPLPAEYVQALRRWADANDALLIFDEVQTGFARTGRLFAHEHYGVRGDLICIGKGLSSTLPVAAVLGSHEVLDLIPPAEITTTHAAHPVSCAAALANLDVIRDENLVAEAERKGNIAAKELACLQERFPGHISGVAGFGLLRGIHVRNPDTGAADPGLARDWTWAGVKHGVMLFQVNRPSIKVVPPLVIEDAAIKEGVAALGDALASIV